MKNSKKNSKMKNFKIKYAVQASSIYGKYSYTCVDTVNAINEQEATSIIIKSQAANKRSFKSFKVLIKSVEEVDMSVEIHK